VHLDGGNTHAGENLVVVVVVKFSGLNTAGGMLKVFLRRITRERERAIVSLIDDIHHITFIEYQNPISLSQYLDVAVGRRGQDTGPHRLLPCTLF
jgi:hypothetical protein